MDLQLKGKVVLITGGSKGIGLACARAFVAEGARVALAARNAEVLHAAAVDLRASGAEVLAVPVDLGDAGDCADADGLAGLHALGDGEGGVVEVGVSLVHGHVWSSWVSR